jgi:gliding motility-associated-like protein
MMQRPSTLLRIVLLQALLLAGGLRAQLTVSPQADLNELARAISGPGVGIANPSINCHPLGYGEFSYTGQVLGVNEGVLLTSGRITDAIGPNTVENRTFQAQTPGSALLNALTGRTTYDACRFEFDVIPGGDTLRFDFAFASEEYNEWVGSQFNDVFGFFISGPGIAGDPGIAPEKNIALIPNTTQAVTINNVNNGSNQAYYFDNAGGQHIQYDGIARGLKAVAHVQPCQTYRLKLIVADASDRKFDSGVFIERLSSNSVTIEAFTANGTPNVVEGCNPGTIRFTRQNVSNTPLVVPFFLMGSATNGVDYPLIGDPDPMVAKTVTIPANQASVDVPINAMADGVTEGLENVRVYLGNCPGQFLDSLDLWIQDSLSTSVNASHVICPGGSVQLSAQGGLAYTWSPPTALNNANSATPIASPSETTTYSVTIAAGACASTLTTTVQVNTIALSATTTAPLCHGGGNGAINLSVSGGSAPFTFAWTGPSGFSATTEDLVNIATGTYTVTVTDAAGCTRTQSFTVLQPAALTVSTMPSVLPFGQSIACHGAQTGSITTTLSGGTGPYTYAWSGPAGFSSTAASLTNVGAGTYELLVTDANGCTASATRTLSQPDPLQVGTSVATALSCSGINNGSALASASGGQAPYSYSWNTAPPQIGEMATGLPPGSHTVTITDAYGCQSSAVVTLVEPAPMALEFSNVSHVVQCQGQADPHGQATAVVNGGTPPYSYAWNTIPTQTGATAIFNMGGTYTVTVTDANGCILQGQVTVMQPGQPSASITSVQHVSCFGVNNGSATMVVSGGSNVQSITWNTMPVQTGGAATNLPPGTWTATAQHADGCQTVAHVTINGPSAALALSATNITAVDCHGNTTGSATVIASGGTGPYSYAWNTSPLQTGASATGLAAGTYTATVTDANGCTASLPVSIGQPAAALSVSITGFSNVLCFGQGQGTATAQAQGGTSPYSYSWNTSPAQNGPFADELEAGTYTVTVTDANGCTAANAVTILGPDMSVGAYIVESGNVTCFGANDGFITVGGFGGSNSYTFNWNTSPPQTGASLTGLAPGIYQVEVIDNNGCDTPKYHSFEILGPPSPVAIVPSASPASCSAANDGSASVSVSGGVAPYVIYWGDTDDNFLAWGPDLSGVGPGTYVLEVADDFGCITATTVTVGATNTLGASVAIVQTPCSGGQNGALSATPINGAMPFSFAWSGPDGFTSGEATISGLAEGSYSVTITDGNGCSATISQALNGTQAPALSIATAQAIACAGGADGAITATLNGGTAPFTYAWTNGQGFFSNDASISGLGAGLYTLAVTDANGCTASGEALLQAPDPLDLSAALSGYNGSAVSCATANDGSIALTVNGGTAPYTYSWSNGSGVEDLSGVPAGPYTVTITDANGCTVSATYTLSAPDPLSSTITVGTHNGGFGTSCAAAADGSLSASVGGGTAPYTLQWTGPGGFNANDASLSGLIGGTYHLLVTDANGCTANSQALISTPPPVNVQVNATGYNGGYHISCTGGNNGIINASAAGGVGALSLVWSGPGGFSSDASFISGLSAGTYALVATDENGCTATASVTLTEPDPLDIAALTSDVGAGYAVSCAGNDGSIQLNISGGTPQYGIAWNGPGGFGAQGGQITALAAGAYQATVIDANGCSLTLDVTLGAPDPIAVSFNAVQPPCAGDAAGSIAAVISGGSGNSTIAWSGPGGFSSSDASISGLASGNYTLTVSDALGCGGQFPFTLNAPAVIGTGAYVSHYGSYNIACAGDSTGVIDLAPTGGTAPFTVVVNGPMGSTTGIMSFNGLPAGEYSVLITDANGCALDTTITLTAPTTGVSATLDVSVYPSGTNVSCFGASDGWINAIASGEGPFTYTWRGPDSLEWNTPFIDGLPAGNYNYELVVIDANECTFTTEVTLTQPEEPLSVTGTMGDHNGFGVSCATSTDGDIAVWVAGGNGDNTFTWSGPGVDGSSAADITDLAPGTYTVTVVDMNGCEAQAVFMITAPPAISIDAQTSTFPGGTSISCHGANDGWVQATVAGGVPSHTAIWTGPGGFTSAGGGIDALWPGTYCLDVTDANGCTAQHCVVITEPEPLSAQANSTAAHCAQDIGSATAVASGGSAPYSFVWSNTGTTGTIGDLAPGTYSVLITDANGCTAVATTEVIGTPAVLAAGEATHIACFGDLAGAVAIDVTQGTAPFTYAWSNGADTPLLTDLAAGSYSVLVTDANGCTWQGSWTVEQNGAIDVGLDVSTYTGGFNVSSWGGSNGSVFTSVQGGTPPYSYVWSTGASVPNLTGLGAGTYELEVTDANGCSVRVIITLTEPLDLEMPTGYSPNGDGANDSFIIRGIEAYPNNHLVILNRWGNVVYERINYRNDWNGENSQGQDLPNGTYFAILTVNEGARTLQGYVDLRR